MIQQIINQHKGAIAQVLTQEKLPCRWLGAVQGNLILTYRLRPASISQSSVNKLQALSTTFAAAMGAESCRVQLVNGVFELQIPSPNPVVVRSQQLLNKTSGLNVAVGLDMQGDPVTVDLAQHGAIGWIAPSRRGKTQSMKSCTANLLYQNPNTLVAVACLESKLADWQPFDNIRQSLGVASTPEQWEQLFGWLAEYTEKPPTRRYHILALVDDLPALLERADLKSSLVTIASAGAGVGVHLMIGTQAGGSKAGSGGTLVENNLTARVLYKPSTTMSGARNAGMGGAQLEQLSSIKGDALLLVDGYATRIATSVADDSFVTQIKPGKSEKIYRCWGVQGVQKSVQKTILHCAEGVQHTVQRGVQALSPVVEEQTSLHSVQGVQGVQSPTLTISTGRPLTRLEKLQLHQLYVGNGRNMSRVLDALNVGRGGPIYKMIRSAVDEIDRGVA